MREMGARRPSCEECGLTKLSNRNKWIIDFFNKFYDLIVRENSSTNKLIIDLSSLKIICESIDIDLKDIVKLAFELNKILMFSKNEALRLNELYGENTKQSDKTVLNNKRKKLVIKKR